MNRRPLLKPRTLSAFLALVWLLLWLSACRTPDPTQTPAATAPVNTRAAVRPTVTDEAATAAANKLYLPFTGGEDVPPTITAAVPTPLSSPTPEPPPSPTQPAFPAYTGQPLRRADMGIQIQLHRQELNELLNHAVTLGVGWVKVQVSWKVFQPAPDRYDQDLLRELDHLVSGAHGRDLRVLLGVAKAPEWSRVTTEHDGPPQDPALFGEFMRYLAARYAGNVAAYELWNEANLAREWYGQPLSAEAFVHLVGVGAAGVRAGDPGALIISGAPATTGINDGVNAIDDRVFLKAAVAQRIGDVVDGVGVHPYGWANPPWASVADPDPAASSHNNHPSFFFADTLRDYRALLDAAGYPDLPLWVTEFGWGSFEGLGAAPPPEASFMSDVSQWQQALYIVDAFARAQQTPGVGPLFLWNLNFAPVLGSGFSESGYSLLDLDGAPRPAYFTLEHAPKS